MTKKITNKNAKEKITKAIKKVATAGLREIKTQRPRATGLWGHAIKIETANRFIPKMDVIEWCTLKSFPLPNNDTEQEMIEGLYDYNHYLLRRAWREFFKDMKDILSSERARIFYLGYLTASLLSFLFFYF